MTAADIPIIDSIVPEQTLHGETTATIWVENVITTGKIKKVWAVIKPPAYGSEDSSEPVLQLPTLEMKAAGSTRYNGTYSDFTTVGSYEIAVYAMDTDGNISLPVETKVVQTK